MPLIDTRPAFFAISQAALNVFVGRVVVPPPQLWTPYAAPCVAQEKLGARRGLGDYVVTIVTRRQRITQRIDKIRDRRLIDYGGGICNEAGVQADQVGERYKSIVKAG